MDTQWVGVWYSLPLITKLFVVLLVVLGAYAAYFVLFLLVRLHSQPGALGDSPHRAFVERLNHRYENLRQCTAAMFYVFGLTYFLQLRFAFWTADESRYPVGAMVVENFISYFHYAAVVFALFLLIHSAQWFASSRIRRATLRAGKVVVG